MSEDTVRCHSCGKQVHIDAESCGSCNVSLLGLCECGENISVFHERCRSCGRTQNPKRYGSRRRWLWLALPLAILLVAAVAAWKLFPRDPFAERLEILKAAQQDVESERFDSARIRLTNYIEEYDAEAGAYYLLGKAYYGLEKRTEGERFLREALHRDPGLNPARVLIAYERYRDNDLQGSLEMAREALKSPPPPPEAHLLIGRILMLPGYRDPAAAERHLAAAVNLGIDKPEPLVLLAELTLNRLRFSPSEIADAESAHYLRAARTFAEARLKEDHEGEEEAGLYEFLARCDYAVEDFGKARESLETADRLAPLGDDGRLLLAKVRWRLGEEQAGRAIMERLLEQSTSMWALLEMHEFARRNMNARFAAGMFERIRGSFPGNPEVTIVQANLHVLSGEAGPAEDVLRAGWAAHPGDDRFLLLLVDLLAAKVEGAKEAEEMLRTATKDADPASPLTLRLIDHLLDTVPPGEGGAGRLDEAARMLSAADGDAAAAETSRSRRRLLSGRLHLARGEFTQALLEFRAVADKSTADPRPHLLLSAAHRALGDFESEAMALSTALRITGPAFEILRQRALSHLDGGRPELARKDCLAALSLRPGDPGVLTLLAGIHMRKDVSEPRRAAELLQQVIDGGDDGVQVRLDLARARFANGEQEKARAEATRARELATTPGDHLAVANLLFGVARTGHPGDAKQTALDIVSELLAENPENGSVGLAAAGVLLQHGEFEIAGDLIEGAVARNPGDLNARRLLFDLRLDRVPPREEDIESARSIARETGDLDEASPVTAYMKGRLALIDDDRSAAVRLLRKAVNAGLSRPGPRHFLSVALLAKGDMGEARALAEAVVKDHPGFLQGRVLLATIVTEDARNALLVGEAADAARMLEEAMGSISGMPSTRLLLARAHFLNSLTGESESLDRAREECERTIAHLDASDDVRKGARLAHALLLLGDICYCSRDLEGTVQACRRYRELRPEDPVADVRLSVALLESGDSAGAVDAVEAAIEKAPASFGLLTAKVAVLEGAGQWEEGVRAIRKWIVKRPKDAAALCLAGEMLVRAGKFEEAEASFRRAIDLQADALPAISGLYQLLSRSARWDELDGFLAGLAGRSGWGAEVTALSGQSLLLRDPNSAEGRAKLESAMAKGISNPVIKADTFLALILAYSRDGSPGRIVQRWREFREWTGTAPTIFDADPYSAITAELHFMGSLAFGELGADDQSELLLREALKLRPDHVPALNNLATLLLEDPMRTDECLELAEAAVKLAPEFPEVLDTFARALLPGGRVREAHEAVTKAIEIAERQRPEEVQAALHVTRAGVLLSLGRRDDARGALDTAKRLHPKIEEQPDYRRTLRLLRSR